MPVHPYSKTALHAFKCYVNFFIDKTLRQFEIQDIIRHRIKKFRNLSRLQLVRSVPRILGVHIRRCIISLHLNMCRYMDIIPPRNIIIFCPEPIGSRMDISAIMELPQPVKAHPQGGFAGSKLIHAAVSDMVRVCLQAVVLKYRRVLLNFLVTEFFHIPPRMILCVKTALSAPVLGWESASVKTLSLLF